MSQTYAPSTFAAVPVKDLFGTKSRLAPLLDPGGRAGLTLYMMKRVISVLRRGSIPEGNLCVVSPDRHVLQTAAEAGAAPLAQSGTGLNPALDEARQWAISCGASSLLVLPADLPLLTADDIGGLLAAGEEAPVAISSDASGTGTNALLLHPPEAMPFLFGSGSYRAHLEAARQRGLRVRECDLANVYFDIDTIEDLSKLDLPGEPGAGGWAFSRGMGRT